MLRPQGALTPRARTCAPTLTPPPPPQPPPRLAPCRCLPSTSSGYSTSPISSLSSSPRSAPRGTVHALPLTRLPIAFRVIAPLFWWSPRTSVANPSRLPYPFVACVFRQDAETPHVVEVQGKGHSYELHIPEHFDEACSIMEACRLQACASGNSGRESEAAVIGEPPSLAAAAQAETHPYGTAGEDGGAAAGGHVGLAGAAAGGPR